MRTCSRSSDRELWFRKELPHSAAFAVRRRRGMHLEIAALDNVDERKGDICVIRKSTQGVPVFSLR
jgi:hypothetical protein